jgi:hypothetical protein
VVRKCYAYHAWRWKSWWPFQTSSHEGGTVPFDIDFASVKPFVLIQCTQRYSSAEPLMDFLALRVLPIEPGYHVRSAKETPITSHTRSALSLCLLSQFLKFVNCCFQRLGLAIAFKYLTVQDDGITESVESEGDFCQAL